jgi:hypothetical protein
MHYFLSVVEVSVSLAIMVIGSVASLAPWAIKLVLNKEANLLQVLKVLSEYFDGLDFPVVDNFVCQKCL